MKFIVKENVSFSIRQLLLYGPIIIMKFGSVLKYDLNLKENLKFYREREIL